MSLTISIRFLTGRAHLNPWQTHHSEGRVECPPSQWRLLRALVAVAGRGLTSLPNADFVFDPGKKPKPTKKNPNPVWPSVGYESLPDNWSGDATDVIPLSGLAGLLHTLSATPTVWLPRTAGGHTRQYFPTDDPDPGRWIKPTGSPVFDTFATIRKDQPLLFHWSAVDLSDQQMNDLRLLLSRITYFGRAESWCQAEAHVCPMEEITAEGMSAIVPENGKAQTHWKCPCIEDHGRPAGQEYRDYLLERRLAPIADLKQEVPELLPRTNSSDGKKRKQADADALKTLLAGESPEALLLRCLLRESGQDIKDGLERPIGTRWVHYAVPRAVYDVSRAKPQPRPKTNEPVDLVRFALNTATVGRAVLPAVTDTLLVADRFRCAVMALCRQPGVALSGHESDGSPCKDHQHAWWWPLDEDNDGFIDHVLVYAPGSFEQREINALRRLTRLRQRGGRPDLLVTPTYAGQANGYPSWQFSSPEDGPRVFVSATPFFCSVHLSHGRGKSGRIRSLRAEVIKSLRLQGVINTEDEVFEINEIVFDYMPNELVEVATAVANHHVAEPMPPRQYFPVIDPPEHYSPLPKPTIIGDGRYTGAALKDVDADYCFGSSIGLVVDGTCFIRAVSFCRRRRRHELHGRGRMLQITFSQPRQPRPFAIGAQSHYGMGLFVPAGG